MIDISKISQVRPNDIATIIGQDGQDSITAVDFATWDDTIANEILTDSDVVCQDLSPIKLK